MSQAALFGFGSVIFFIVMTGALLYGMAVAKEIFDRDESSLFRRVSHYSLTDEDAWWEAIK